MSAPNASVRIAFVGDIVPSRPFPNSVPDETAGVLRLLQNADVAFGDLEMPMSDRGVPEEKFIAFGGSPTLAQDLPKIGVDILSLATNHSMDQGTIALFDTIDELRKVGIDSLGVGANLEEAEQLLVREVGGARIGFLAWSCLLPNGAAAGPKRAGLAPIHVHTSYEVNPSLQMEEPGNPPLVRTRPDDADLERVSDVVRAAANEVDFLIVSMHWGFGSTSELAEYQPTVGHALVDAGADLVVGAHVHAVQGVEQYRGRTIAYGLGNFVAQQPREGLSEEALQLLDEMSKDALVALLDMEADGSYRLSFTPVTAGETGLPVSVSEADENRIVRQLVNASAKLGTQIYVEPENAPSITSTWDVS